MNGSVALHPVLQLLEQRATIRQAGQLIGARLTRAQLEGFAHRGLGAAPVASEKPAAGKHENQTEGNEYQGGATYRAFQVAHGVQLREQETGGVSARVVQLQLEIIHDGVGRIIGRFQTRPVPVPACVQKLSDRGSQLQNGWLRLDRNSPCSDHSASLHAVERGGHDQQRIVELAQSVRLEALAENIGLHVDRDAGLHRIQMAGRLQASLSQTGCIVLATDRRPGRERAERHRCQCEADQGSPLEDFRRGPPRLQVVHYCYIDPVRARAHPPDVTPRFSCAGAS